MSWRRDTGASQTSASRKCGYSRVATPRTAGPSLWRLRVPQSVTWRSAEPVSILLLRLDWRQSRVSLHERRAEVDRLDKFLARLKTISEFILLVTGIAEAAYLAAGFVAVVLGAGGRAVAANALRAVISQTSMREASLMARTAEAAGKAALERGLPLASGLGAAERGLGARATGPVTRSLADESGLLVGGNQARGIAGESGMGFAYRYEEGWAFLEGPSGGLGHRWNAPGFDGVAFRIRGDFELEILDNKSLARLGNVSSASALTTNLRKNLDDLITRANSASLNDVPRIAELRGALRDTRIALDSGGKMPSNVRLVVTNAGGRSTGVTTRLAQQGIEFRSL
jgi:hypothetical protein